MFFFLSKTIYYLLMPAVLLSICLVLMLIVKNKKWKKRFTISFVSLFLLFTNSFIINEVFLLWEIPSRPSASIEAPYDVAVVFTGMVNSYKSPFDRVHFDKGADRIYHAINLYKLGKVKKIILSGGTGKLIGDGVSEAQLLSQVLLDCAVAAEDIIIESKAMNTHENALYTSQILNEKFRKKRIVLITSAFHMRRSAACLSKQGIEFDTYSVDFYSVDRSFDFNMWIPNEYTFHKSEKLIHEIIGYITYKLMGYA